MSSTRPESGPVHPEVSADAGAAEVVELSDEEVLRQLQEAGVDLAASDDDMGDKTIADADTRNADESGAWRTIPPTAPGEPMRIEPAFPLPAPTPKS